MTDPGWASVLDGAEPHVRELAVGAQRLLRRVLPGTEEESDVSAKLLGFAYRGAELAATDDSGLLEGTGKLARHTKIRSVACMTRRSGSCPGSSRSSRSGRTRPPSCPRMRWASTTC